MNGMDPVGSRSCCGAGAYGGITAGPYIVAGVTVIGIEYCRMVVAVHDLTAMAIQTTAGAVGVAGNPRIHGAGANLERNYTDGNDLVRNNVG